MAWRYFEGLFTCSYTNEYASVLCKIQRVMVEDNIKLLSPLSKCELYAALMDMHPDKSPGPDGFNPNFY